MTARPGSCSTSPSALRAEGITTPIQIAHGQFLADADIPRLRALDVSADISPFIWYPGVIPRRSPRCSASARSTRSRTGR